MEQSIEEVIESYRKFFRLAHSGSPNESLDELRMHYSLQRHTGPLYETYLKSFRRDLDECVSLEQLPLHEKTAFSFMDIWTPNALCVISDVMGRPLEYPLIILDTRLFYVLQQLFTAVIFEELQGNLLQYKCDGSEAFKCACRLFKSPSSANVDQVQLVLPDANAQREVQAYLSMVTTITMQFIALHEFGHAWLGHHEQQSAARLLLIGEAEVSQDQIKFRHEFDADEFAMKALISRSKSVESNWANLYAIGYFFEFIAVLEGQDQYDFERTHPPAKERLTRLRNLLALEVGRAEEFQYLEERTRELISKWTNQPMNSFLNIAVNATDASGLVDAFTQDTFKISPIEGAEIEFLGRSRGKGMLEAQDVILLGIGFLGAVPVNLLSSWIFEKLNPTQANIVVVRVDSEAATTPEELAEIIARKITK